MIYVALKLDDYSQKLIKKKLKPFIPEWNIFAQNIILHSGRAERNDIIGMATDFTAIEFGYTDKLMAIKVEGLDFDNPYIIVATNPKERVNPSDAKNIKNWFKLKIPFVLRGKLVEYKQRNGVKVVESLIDEPKDKSQIIRVAFYDFDKTLVDTVSAEEGRAMWEKAKKRKYTQIGWWSKKESLDPDVFEFKPIEEVTERLKKDFKDKSCWTVLLTNRIVGLKAEVLDILGQLGLELDEIKMVERGGLNKNSRINVVLESLPQANLIEVYDDDMGNIEMFLDLKKHLNQQGKSFSIYHVNPENFTPRLTLMASN